MSTSTVNTIFGDMVASVSSVLATNIPLVLVVVAALIGLSFLVRYVKRHIVGGRG